MKFFYEQQVLEDLKDIDKTQIHMLLDYFENQYTHSRKLKEKGHVFKTGPWRILFVLEVDQIRVLRIIQ